MVSIEAGPEVESANVTLDYGVGGVSNESDLAVFRYNRSKQTFVKLDSRTDAKSNTVTGKTEEFGTFVVFEQSAWAVQFADPLPTNWSDTGKIADKNLWSCFGENDPTCETSSDEVTVGAQSTEKKSVATLQFGIACRMNADGECIPESELEDDDGDGVINYDDECDTTPGAGTNGCPIDSDGDGIRDSEDTCPNEAGTYFGGCPLDSGDEDDEDDGNTGGDDDDDYDPSPPSDDPDADDPTKPIDEGERVSNSTYGRSLTFSNAKEIRLEAEVSGQAKGERSTAMFVIVDEDREITELFEITGEGDDSSRSDSDTIRRDLSEFAGERVSFRLVALNDSQVTLESMRISYDTDGDGLADSVETGGIRTGRGETYFTDKYNADTDGDGLSDGQEVGVRTLNDYGQYFRLESNPVQSDSDRDGLTDYEETRVWSELDPLSVNTDNDAWSDYEDPNPTVYDEVQQDASDVSIIDASGNYAANAARGAFYGEYGIVKDLEGSHSLEYFGGWLAFSIVPVADAAADTRDCVVWTNETGANILDCGGAGVSVITSGGTVLGAVTSWTGVGAGVAAGSFAIDTAEDVTDATVITVKFIRHNPELAAATGKLLILKTGGKIKGVPKRVVGRLGSTKTISEFRKGVTEGNLVKSGVQKRTASTLADVSVETGVSTQRIVDVTKQIDGFNDQPTIIQKRILKTALDSEDGAFLAQRLDARALRDIAIRQNALDAGVELIEFGVRPSRVEELAHNGIRLDKHLSGLKTIRNSGYAVSERGDVGEILAAKTVLPKYLKSGDEILPPSPQKGIDIFFSDGSKTEIDHLIRNSDGKITMIFETKIGHKRLEAEGQVINKVRKIIEVEVTDKAITKTSPEGISANQIEIQPFEPGRDVDKMITVGPKNAGFDESLGYTRNELHELFKTLDSMEN
ncbi:hypothetical protein [Haloferax sp. DFSO60]|uniref:hypothetical protein n=1 Tax=Haloferax sp. DFSO60 TaxID=3388652 RepID=UPI003979D579